MYFFLPSLNYFYRPGYQSSYRTFPDYIVISRYWSICIPPHYKPIYMICTFWLFERIYWKISNRSLQLYWKQYLIDRVLSVCQRINTEFTKTLVFDSSFVRNHVICQATILLPRSYVKWQASIGCNCN